MSLSKVIRTSLYVLFILFENVNNVIKALVPAFIFIIFMKTLNLNINLSGGGIGIMTIILMLGGLSTNFELSEFIRGDKNE